MPIVSYAQNFEDVMLWRALGHVNNGFYIDIGAQDPVVDSISLAFRQHGWQGIHVEPAPHYAEMLRHERAGDTVLQAAVGHTPGVLRFFEIANTGISTADPVLAQQHRDRGFDVREIFVPCITLASIFASCAGIDIHWLKIDVEGSEQQVLSGWGASPARPWVIVVESTVPLTQVDSSDRWEFMLLRMGYVPAYSDGLNRYYVSDAHPELKTALHHPPNVLDGFILNGTASHSFHHLVRDRAQRQLDDIRAQVEQQIQDAKTALERSLDREHGLSRQLEEALQKAEREKANLMSVHGEQARELQRQHTEVFKALAHKHWRDIAAKQEAQARLIRTCTEREAVLQAQIQASHRIISQLTQTVQEARARRKSRNNAPVKSAPSWLGESFTRRALGRAGAAIRRPAPALRNGHVDGLRNGHVDGPAPSSLPLSQPPPSAVRALLGRSDRDFLYSAYYQILGRAPDSGGFEHYLQHLRAGLPKLEILGHLRQSPEGKTRNSTVAGLDAAIEQYQHSQRPAVARAIKGLRAPRTPRARRNGPVDADANGSPRPIAEQPSPAANPLTPNAGRKVRGSNRGRRIYYYVDHTILCPLNTGIQQVTRRLGSALLEAGADVRFVKWAAERRRFALPNHEELAYLAHWNETPTSDLTQVELIKGEYPARAADPVFVESDGGDDSRWLVVPELPHTTFHGRPVTLDVLMEARRLGFKTAFIFYDAIPLTRKEHADMARRHEAYMDQLLLADVIVPVSAWSGRDLVSYMHVHVGAAPTTRIVPLHLPGEFAYLAAGDSERDEESGTRNLILSVGSIVQHKNQIALVHAFDRYCKAKPATDWELALVGNLHPDSAHAFISAVEQNPRIRYLAHISDAELRDLYRACRFTVFPSVEEGFGLPILESLGHGKPCLCANFGAMAEVAEGGGCYPIDTRKEDELFRAVSDLIETPTILSELSQQALQRQVTTWHDYGTKLLSCLDEVADPLKNLGIVYYWLDRTPAVPSNTGIQRVVRCLARALIGIGIKLVPVRWDESARRFCTPTKEELENLARWNGPGLSDWHPWVDPDQATTRDWTLIPEITTSSTGKRFSDVREFAWSRGVRMACVFHGAIPWVMCDPYPGGAAQAHEQYLADINECELILPISETIRDELIAALSVLPIRTPSLESRIQAAVLPGEFSESERILEPKNTVPKVVAILCPGTVEPSANHLGLLTAFEEMAGQTRRPVELVIAGPGPFTALAAQVRQYVDAVSGIRWESRPTDERLSELYAACDFTVFPSPAGTRSLSILESLWRGRPCVCSRTPGYAELAEAGGCLMTETADAHALAVAMLRMVEDDTCRSKLGREAVARPMKSWRDYASEIAARMAMERYVSIEQPLPPSIGHDAFYRRFINLSPPPLLSICISTHNRADRLSVNLRNLSRLLPTPRTKIEIVVCDCGSLDHTPDVVKPYLGRADFHYHRNPHSVDMLKGFTTTAHHARGRYVWMLGDDDLIKPGAIERILEIVDDHPGIALIYLNCAFAHNDDRRTAVDVDQLAGATPAAAPAPDTFGSVSQICTEAENFFTAISGLILRRDHAWRAYGQNTDGRPFSTMLTCAPTAYYVLSHMMNEPAYWVGEPQVVVNRDGSWKRYPPLWALERVPEICDLAERMGADPLGVDRWRNNDMENVVECFKEVYENDLEPDASSFSPSRLMARIKHIDGFKKHVSALRSAYERAHYTGHPAAKMSVSNLFALEEPKVIRRAEPRC